MNTLTLYITNNVVGYTVWQGNRINQSGLLANTISNHNNEEFWLRHNLRALILTYEIDKVVISSNPKAKLRKTIISVCLSEMNRYDIILVPHIKNRNLLNISGVANDDNPHIKKAAQIGQDFINNTLTPIDVHPATKDIKQLETKIYWKHRCD